MYVPNILKITNFLLVISCLNGQKAKLFVSATDSLIHNLIDSLIVLEHMIV